MNWIHYLFFVQTEANLSSALVQKQEAEKHPCKLTAHLATAVQIFVRVDATNETGNGSQNGVIVTENLGGVLSGTPTI